MAILQRKPRAADAVREREGTCTQKNDFDHYDKH